MLFFFISSVGIEFLGRVSGHTYVGQNVNPSAENDHSDHYAWRLSWRHTLFINGGKCGGWRPIFSANKVPGIGSRTKTPRIEASWTKAPRDKRPRLG